MRWLFGRGGIPKELEQYTEGFVGVSDELMNFGERHNKLVIVTLDDRAWPYADLLSFGLYHKHGKRADRYRGVFEEGKLKTIGRRFADSGVYALDIAYDNERYNKLIDVLFSGESQPEELCYYTRYGPDGNPYCQISEKSKELNDMKPVLT